MPLAIERLNHRNGKTIARGRATMEGNLSPRLKPNSNSASNTSIGVIKDVHGAGEKKPWALGSQ
jgi:hypothetical protein